jgi:hypothetical protein
VVCTNITACVLWHAVCPAQQWGSRNIATSGRAASSKYMDIKYKLKINDFWTSLIIRYYKNWRTHSFGDWICFRPVVKWETVEAPTFSRQSAHRRPRGQTYAPAVLYPQEYSWYSFLIDAESTEGPYCGWKDYENRKVQWPHRESNPQSSGL